MVLRSSVRWAAAVLVAVGVSVLGGCGNGGEPPQDSRPPSDQAAAGEAGPLEYQVDEPPPDVALRISVVSAQREDDGGVTLVLEGLYQPENEFASTMWASDLAASTEDGSCDVTAVEPFPDGPHPAGSTVQGTWSLDCPGTGEVSVLVDPFGGLLAGSDVTTRITLR